MQSLPATNQPEKAVYGRSLKAGVATLAGELDLAFSWNRPAILIAVTKNKDRFLQAQQSLELELKKKDTPVIRVNVDNNGKALVKTLVNYPTLTGSVFFITNIGNGGGIDGYDAYRTLNLQREAFVEHQIRAVFWLTEIEASILPRHALDFWAFRHRVVEFISSKITQKKIPAGIFLWHSSYSSIAEDEIRASIKYQQEMLAQSLDAASRLQTLTDLACLYWRVDNLQKSSENIQQALQLAGNNQVMQFHRTQALNAQAILEYVMGDVKHAVFLFDQSLEEDETSAILIMNSALIEHALSRNGRAKLKARQALKLDPGNLQLWNAAGYLYMSMGRFDDAQYYIEETHKRDPDNIAFLYALAACAFLAGHYQHSKELIMRIEGMLPVRRYLHNLYKEIIMNGREQALAQLKLLQAGKGQIRLDPNLSLLLE